MREKLYCQEYSKIHNLKKKKKIHSSGKFGILLLCTVDYTLTLRPRQLAELLLDRLAEIE